MEPIKLSKSFAPKLEVDFHKIDNIEFEDVDHKDYPDYCDAFISSCDIDGRPATEEELDIINDDRQFVYESLMDQLY